MEAGLRHTEAAGVVDDVVTRGLRRLLTDTYGLYLLTHDYHWAMRGPEFPALRSIVGQQSLALVDPITAIAAHLRSLGLPAPADYRDFAVLPRTTTVEAALPTVQMVRRIIAEHEATNGTARAVAAAAGRVRDLVTVELATRRADAHAADAAQLCVALAGPGAANGTEAPSS